MIQHPSITAALADQRRAAFMAEAETARLAREARAARNGGDRSAKRPRASSHRAGSPASQQPAAAWPACAPRAPVERVRRARWRPAHPGRTSQLVPYIRNIRNITHMGAGNVQNLVSGTSTADSSQEGTVMALAAITVTSATFLEGTVVDPASTRLKSTLA